MCTVFESLIASVHAGFGGFAGDGGLDRNWEWAGRGVDDFAIVETHDAEQPGNPVMERFCFLQRTNYVHPYTYI